VEEAAALPHGLPDILVAQAMLPVLNRQEMRGKKGDVDVSGDANEIAAFDRGEEREIWEAIMERILAIPEYVARFNAAFGHQGRVHRFEDAARAIAEFQMEAFTFTRSPFDRYLDRNDAALTAEQKRGGLLFFGKARCSNCHAGPFLGGQGFVNVGVPQIGSGGNTEPPLDLGRGELPDNEFYRFAFRVAPLRNVELTAPYMHNGAYPTLDAVVRHYNDVPDAMRTYDARHHAPAVAHLHHDDEATVSAIAVTLDGRLQAPLDLTEEEMSDLIAFLHALTDPEARNLGSLVPARVPSGLPLP
jgi:cytochrome c peroxidase